MLTTDTHTYTQAYTHTCTHVRKALYGWPCFQCCVQDGSTARARIVVGADGNRSALRSALFSGEQPEYIGECERGNLGKRNRTAEPRPA
jgi:2-polyprenyl-6-methoxyphenol hydroxylase-like FAD-dependent oxidoreductase